MIQIQHLDFMRAVLFHKLDVRYSCDNISRTGGCGHYTLGYDRVCEETFDGFGGKQRTETTMVTESFKKQYIDTLPEDAVRCRSCSKRVGCDIIRLNLDEHCNVWSK